MSTGQVARPLTDAEVEAWNKELNDLRIKAEVQCAEQCAFLKKQIALDTRLNNEQRNRLMQIVEEDGFKVRVFRVTSSNVLQKPHVQVTYDIHDDLYAYLRQPDSQLPKMLVGFLEGGIDISQGKATAEDTMPLTGKTKTGIPALDAKLGLLK